MNPYTFARRSSKAVAPSLFDTVKPSGYGDFLVVNELGSGISRGCMNYGRLYQGKYIPPERTDGLILECEDNDGESENVIGEDVSMQPSADIDLDWVSGERKLVCVNRLSPVVDGVENGLNVTEVETLFDH